MLSWLMAMTLTSMTRGLVHPFSPPFRGVVCDPPALPYSHRGARFCSSSSAACDEESWLTPETPTEVGREAFVFPPKPLPEGTVLRGMQESDVDSVVDL